MEHLTYYPPADARKLESDAVAAMDVLEVVDWEAWDRTYGACEHSSPEFQWLGFPHDDIDDGAACQKFGDYARKHKSPVSIRWADIGEDKDHPRTAAQDANISWELYTTLLVSFAQSWVYIGTLEVCLQRRVKLSFITRTTVQGALGIYSRAVPYALWKRRSDLTTANPLVKQTALQSIGICLKDATMIVAYLMIMANKLQKANDQETSLREFILTAIRPLAHLHELVSCIFFPGKLATIPKHLPSMSSERLVARGWCPFLLSWTGLPFGLLFPDWLIATSMVNRGNHQACDRDKCLQNNIDIENYKTVHRTKYCPCDFIRPNFQEIEDSLMSGAVPLIRLSKGDTKMETLSYVPLSNQGYVAFSHVWSNGLGSCAESGLPTCQLQWLSRLAKEASGSDEIYFWIDSLCVPENVTLRKLAISLMHSTFKEATKTIVVDESISQLTLNTHWSHCAWTIISSPWMQRLWTFQEGMLAKNLLFLVKDGFMFSKTLIHDIRQVRDLYPLAYHVHSILVLLLDKSRGTNEGATLGNISQHLSIRSTSKPQDELLAISGLLGLKLDKIYELSGEERLKEFYLQVVNVPWNIVFDCRPKMKSRPFTWAPSTFLSHSEYTMGQNCAAVCCQSGLKVHMTILHIGEAVSTTKFSVLYDFPNFSVNSPRFWELGTIKVANRHASSERISRIDKFGLFYYEVTNLPEVEFDAILLRTFRYLDTPASVFTNQSFAHCVAVKRLSERDASSGLPVYTVMLGGELLIGLYPSSNNNKSDEGEEGVSFVRGHWAQQEILLV